MANNTSQAIPSSGGSGSSGWLWAATAIFTVSFFVFAGLSYAARAGEKIFHHLFTIALLVGSITYFAIASSLGSVSDSSFISLIGKIFDKGLNHALSRSIFVANCTFWVVSFPTMIISLGLLSGISWATILYHVFLSWVWVISYLASAWTGSLYKWGFFAFGTVAWILLAVGTLSNGLAGARRVGIVRDYALLAGWTNFLWLLHPIALGLAFGSNKIGHDRIGTAGVEIFYSVLDILMVPVLGFAILLLSRNWDYDRLNIAFTQYGRVNAPAGNFPDKAPAAAAAVPAGDVVV